MGEGGRGEFGVSSVVGLDGKFGFKFRDKSLCNGATDFAGGVDDGSFLFWALG
jgi:hypothetical protein